MTILIDFSAFILRLLGYGGQVARNDGETFICCDGNDELRFPSHESRDTNMIVGTMTARLHLNGLTSLKQKRGIVKSLIGRLKSRFNISIAEVDHQDNKTSAVIAIAVVGNDSRFINQQLDTITGFIQKDGRFYLGKIERELF